MMSIFSPWFWSHTFYVIRCFFNPRQKWLTKQIPKTYCDKDELIRLTLFAILVDFVEHEMEITDWTWCEEKVCAKAQIEMCYNYIKKERPILQKKMSDAYPDNPDNLINFDITKEQYFAKYGEVDRLEKLIRKMDDNTLETITKCREYLWT